MRQTLLISLFISLLATSIARATAAEPKPFSPHIERYDAALDQIVAPNAKVEKLGEGYTWAEGPVWIKSGNYLLFSDVPGNTIYRWSEGQGIRVFLRPSGYAGPDTGVLREGGSNGLFADRPGTILLADSGNRNISRLDLEKKTKTTVVANYQGKRLNSPNDVVRRGNGAIYFTDPPFGLKNLNDSKIKELKFNGVFRLDPNGTLSIVDDSLSLPNGIALSPDERTLYVANSDDKSPIWMAYSLDADGKVLGKKVFADSSDLLKEGKPGRPDGMKVSADGHLFASAPGGILIMTAQGKRLGRIETGDVIANCAFGDDGYTLYMTSHKILARVRLVAANR